MAEKMSRRWFIAAGGSLVLAGCSLTGEQSTLDATESQPPIILDGDVFSKKTPFHKEIVGYFKDQCEGLDSLRYGERFPLISAEGTANITVIQGDTTQTGSSILLKIEIISTKEKWLGGILADMVNGNRTDFPSRFSEKDPILVRVKLDRPLPVLTGKPRCCTAVGVLAK